MPKFSSHLEGPGPYGFRLFGGCGQPLVIAKVRPGSKADEAGIKEGDILLSINGENCFHLSPADAMSRVDRSGNGLSLNVARDETDIDSLINTYLDFNSTDSRVSTLDRSSYGGSHNDSSRGGGYTRQEETGYDGNTTRRRVTESEKYGGTTLTRTTDESFSSWNNYDRPSSAIPAKEPVFRTTSATRDSTGRLPANPGGAQMTFDLGRSISNELNYSSSPSRLGVQSPSKSGVWSPSNHGPSPLTVDFDTHNIGSGLRIQTSTSGFDRPAVSPMGSDYQSVWRPAKHETPPRPFDPSQPQVGEPFTFSVPTTVSDIYHHKPWEHTKQEYWKTPPKPSSDEIKENLTTPSSRFAAAPQKSWKPPANDTTDFNLDFGLDSALKSDSLFNVSKPVTPSDSTKWKPNTISNEKPSGDSGLSTSSRSGRTSKFDSDKGYVDPFSANGGLVREDSRTSRVPFPDLPPRINKILTEPAESAEITALTKRKFADDGEHERKVFSDSSFYADPKNIYPTVEEQVKMARVVAHSLTSGANASARGQQMFLKRKQKADAWVVDNISAGKSSKPALNAKHEDDVYYNPDPWNPAKEWKPLPTAEDLYNDTSSIPAPPPLPSSLLFAPRGEPKSKGLSADEFERVRLYGQKTKHDTVSPQVCFNLAKDLRESKGKGGRMFAKRRARAEQFIVEGEGKGGPNPAVMSKIELSYAQETALKNPSSRMTSQRSNEVTSAIDDIDYTKAPVVNRLKQMIEMPKPKITPWDAVAEHGNVDLAFEHLDDYYFFPKSSSGSSYTRSTSHTSYVGPTSSESFDVPAPPPGPPSWMKNQNITQSSDKQWPLPAPSSSQSGSRTDFSARSSGYKPVNFSLKPNPGINGIVPGLSDF